MRSSLLLALSLFLVTGCLTRAPTTYELDRRAGLELPSTEQDQKNVQKDLSGIRTNSTVPRGPEMPVRLPPLVEKVWVSDMTLADGVKLQGTWLFLEVEPGRWIDEYDQGGGALATPDMPELGTKKRYEGKNNAAKAQKTAP